MSEARDRIRRAHIAEQLKQANQPSDTAILDWLERHPMIHYTPLKGRISLIEQDGSVSWPVFHDGRLYKTLREAVRAAMNLLGE